MRFPQLFIPTVTAAVAKTTPMKQGQQQPQYFLADVQLIASSRTVPKEAENFDGFWRGSCKVLACAARPHLLGRDVLVEIPNVVAHAPYFTFRLPVPLKKDGSGGLQTERSTLVLIVGCKAALSEVDLAFLAREIEPEEKGPAHNAINALYQSAITQGHKHVALAQLEACPMLAPLLYEQTALVRAQYLQPLFCHLLGAQVVAAEQRKRINELPTDALKSLVTLLKTEPWELVFKYPLKTTYGRVKPMSFAAYTQACKEYGVVVPQHVTQALKLYCSVRGKRNVHTLNAWSDHVAVLASEGLSADDIVAMRAYLEKRAICFWPPVAPPLVSASPMTRGAASAAAGAATAAAEFLGARHDHFALHEHWDDAKRICQALLHYHQLATTWAPAVRVANGDGGGALHVPAVPPTLKGAQVLAAQSILNRCVTVLEGYPGTGKTAVITWAMGYFRNVLLVTLTGAMASSLRDRNGGREEVAHTIDHVIYAARTCTDRGGVRAWLASFDVLIIDEFSNVTTPKFAQLLWLLPNLVRVVLVGDHNQIRSRKEGDPLGDMRDHFSLVVLRDILRVAPTLVNLYEAPKKLSEESVHSLRWSPDGPLTLVEPPRQPSDVSDRALLKGLLGEVWGMGGRRLMHHQIIVLQNNVRRTLNLMCHELAMEAGIISRHAPSVQIGEHRYCAGTKICFKRNYNQPVAWSETPVATAAAPRRRQQQQQPQPPAVKVWRGDCVVNGECGVITQLHELPRGKGYAVTFVVDDDAAAAATAAAAPKTAIISRSIANAVSPVDIDMGYAITTTKVQGREYRYAIFWNNRGYWANNGYWSRAHPYVALTRGKERVWCVSHKSDLVAMCNKPDAHRRTILREMLAHFAPRFQHLACEVQSAGALHPPATRYELLPPWQRCVPSLADLLAERAAERAKKDK